MGFIEIIKQMGDVFSRLDFLEKENKRLAELVASFEDRKDKRFDSVNSRIDELESLFYSIDETNYRG